MEARVFKQVDKTMKKDRILQKDDHQVRILEEVYVLIGVEIGSLFVEVFWYLILNKDEIYNSKKIIERFGTF